MLYHVIYNYRNGGIEMADTIPREYVLGNTLYWMLKNNIELVSKRDIEGIIQKFNQQLHKQSIDMNISSDVDTFDNAYDLFRYEYTKYGLTCICLGGKEYYLKKLQEDYRWSKSQSILDLLDTIILNTISHAQVAV